jgi:hypothetical protein
MRRTSARLWIIWLRHIDVRESDGSHEGDNLSMRKALANERRPFDDLIAKSEVLKKRAIAGAAN